MKQKAMLHYQHSKENWVKTYISCIASFGVWHFYLKKLKIPQNQAKAQGATDNQALAYGTLAGAAEGLFEKFSLDNIKAMARTDKKSLSNFFLNTLQIMGVEGSKEALAQLSNDFSEMLVLGDNSTLRQVYNDEYVWAIAEGSSESEAQERAWTHNMNVGTAALGGAVMCGVMGGGAQIVGKAVRGIRN